MNNLIVSLRLVIATMAICVGGYAAVVMAFAKIVNPDTAQGSLITNSAGQIIGSSLIAQKFTQPGYFWPRPSAVDYNASGAGGSNKSPTSSDLTERAKQIIAQYGATEKNPLPPELAAASGGGLDPHITEHAALYQASRVATARGLPVERIRDLIARQAFEARGFLTPARLVNVLELNLALDEVAGQ